MLLMAFIWLLVRCPYVFVLTCAMWTASRWHLEHGTIFTSCMCKPESTDSHIARQETCWSASILIQSIWKHSMILQIIISRYKEILQRRYGQRSDALPWFWIIGEPVGTCGSRMQEHKFPNHSLFLRTNLVLVYRVSWLRAKAHFFWWSEELRLVGYKMQWMVNWFWWKGGEWKKRLGYVTNEDRLPGLDCYCHKQIVLWGTLADQVSTKFSTVLGRPLFK